MSAELDHDLDGCFSCGEGEPEQECSKSRRACGHHCNCSWIHDRCCWCGSEFRRGRALSNVNGSKWIRPIKRVRIYARDKWRCLWCGTRTAELTLDHFLSRSAGGTNDATNLVTACFECNSRRRPALEFVAGAFDVLDRAIESLALPLPVYLP
jgi:5-methylcytosine-specific restriction endonuclease McrA